MSTDIPSVTSESDLDDSIEAREERWIHKPTRRLVDTIDLVMDDAQVTVIQTFIHDEILQGAMRRPLFIEDADARSLIQDGESDFLWDRASGLVFSHLGAQHSFVASGLHLMRTPPCFDLDDLAEAMIKHRSRQAEHYIDQGQGFIFSSVSHKCGSRKLVVGKDVRLTRQEQVLLADYTLDRI